jgi:hypothetical protein
MTTDERSRERVRLAGGASGIQASAARGPHRRSSWRPRVVDLICRRFKSGPAPEPAVPQHRRKWHVAHRPDETTAATNGPISGRHSFAKVSWCSKQSAFQPIRLSSSGGGRPLAEASRKARMRKLLSPWVSASSVGGPFLRCADAWRGSLGRDARSCRRRRRLLLARGSCRR